MVIDYISWKDILPFWELLHPCRDHKKFVKMSLKREAEWDVAEDKWDVAEDNLNISFFGVYINDKLCGVYSTHMTPNNLLRSRGLVVLPKYRKQGIATILAKHAIVEAKILKCKGIWAYPRVGSSLNAHLRAGYKQVTKLHETRYGTNCYVLYNI